jgi:hypothetical protein
MWSLPSKLTAIGCYVGIIGVLLSCIFFFFPQSLKPPRVENTTAQLSIRAEGNTGIQQNTQIGTLNVYQSPPPEPVKPLKQRIRDMLRSINPVIIDNLDSGVPQMAVMINQMKLQDLLRLAKEPGFSDYIATESTGSVSMGAHNTIGGHLNDIDDVGTLHGYLLMFKKPLKE